VSSLRSALDELGAEDLDRASDQELEADFCELERTSRVLEAERARRLAEIERRSSWAPNEIISLPAWVARVLRISHAAAGRLAATARALRKMPRTRAALGEGEVSSCAVRVLAAAAEAHPGAFATDEEVLVEAARDLPVRELRHAVAYWRQAADPDRVEADADHLFARRRLHVSPGFEGMVRVDGDLDPETGQTVIGALRAIMDSEARVGGSGGDSRTSAQRRADALGEVCRRMLASPDRPEVAGERPHVVVTVDLETLEGRVPGRCELEDAGPISPETARRIACDAGVSRVITRGRSEPLDVGRKTPVVPAAVRRAVVLRDGHCQWWGCDRPQSWCDAHHIEHWADGGETKLSNLTLLCRPHHRLEHQLSRGALRSRSP